MVNTTSDRPANQTLQKSSTSNLSTENLNKRIKNLKKSIETQLLNLQKISAVMGENKKDSSDTIQVDESDPCAIDSTLPCEECKTVPTNEKFQCLGMCQNRRCLRVTTEETTILCHSHNPLHKIPDVDTRLFSLTEINTEDLSNWLKECKRTKNPQTNETYLKSESILKIQLKVKNYNKSFIMKPIQINNIIITKKENSGQNGEELYKLELQLLQKDKVYFITYDISTQHIFFVFLLRDARIKHNVVITVEPNNKYMANFIEEILSVF